MVEKDYTKIENIKELENKVCEMSTKDFPLNNIFNNIFIRNKSKNDICEALQVLDKIVALCKEWREKVKKYDNISEVKVVDLMRHFVKNGNKLRR